MGGWGVATPGMIGPALMFLPDRMDGDARKGKADSVNRATALDSHGCVTENNLKRCKAMFLFSLSVPSAIYQAIRNLGRENHTRHSLRDRDG